METWLDLHMHSSYSMDGQYTPTEIVAQCAAAGVQAMALSDHDAVAGNAEAGRAAARLGLSYFPAIEISCTHAGKLFHLLGYGIHYDDPAFVKLEKAMQDQRKSHSEAMIEAVRRIGIAVDSDKVWALSVNGSIGSVLIARAALADPRNDENELLAPYRPGGARSDTPYVNFGWDFCAQGKPCNVPMEVITFEEAVALIQEHGGAAVLAHPGANMGQDRERTEAIIATGIDGIEAYCSYHDSETAAFYAGMAAQYGLIATLGSDYHGHRTKPNIDLGRYSHPRPQDVYDRLCAVISGRGGIYPKRERSDLR